MCYTLSSRRKKKKANKIVGRKKKDTMLVVAPRELTSVDDKPVFNTRVGAPTINSYIKDFDEIDTDVYHILKCQVLSHCVTHTKALHKVISRADLSSSLSDQPIAVSLVNIQNGRDGVSSFDLHREECGVDSKY
jgi:hypothetical protein